MKIKDILIYGTTLIATTIFSYEALAAEIVLSDIKQQKTYHTRKFEIPDSELENELKKSWQILDPVTNSGIPGIELKVNGVIYGYTDSTGTILKPTGIEEIVDNQKIPKEHYIKQNYPNPFNPETKIEYCLNKKARVTLDIYNILGQRVLTLLDKEQIPGIYTIIWDGKDNNGNSLSSGIYFYQLNINNQRFKTKKMTLLK